MAGAADISKFSDQIAATMTATADMSKFNDQTAVTMAGFVGSTIFSDQIAATMAGVVDATKFSDQIAATIQASGLHEIADMDSGILHESLAEVLASEQESTSSELTNAPAAQEALELAMASIVAWVVTVYAAPALLAAALAVGLSASQSAQLVLRLVAALIGGSLEIQGAFHIIAIVGLAKKTVSVVAAKARRQDQSDES